jgi:hypothetical protein
VAVILLRTLDGIAGVLASQEFAEGTLLGLAERIAEISSSIRIAGQPGKRGSVVGSTLGTRSGARFPDRRRAGSGTVLAGS